MFVNTSLDHKSTNGLTAKEFLSSSIADTGSRIKSFSKKVICPVCQDADQGCGYKRDGIRQPVFFCHPNSAATKGERVNEFVCIKEASGHTATFAVAQDAEARQPVKEPAKASVVASPDAISMCVQERDKWYTRELSYFSFSDEHRQHLKERGYTDETIKEFKTAAKYPRVKEAPSNLPGVTEKGCFTLKLDRSAILMPVRNINGLITHINVYDPYKTDGVKYKPISCSSNPIHIDGELPIEVYLGDGDQSSLYDIEAGGHKARLAHQNLQIPVIGGGGGQTHLSRRQVREAIEKYQVLYAKKPEIEIVPDAGDYVKSGRCDLIKKKAEFYSGLGLKVSILWWGQEVKGQDKDIDELTSEEFLAAKKITLDDFLALGKDLIKEAENKLVLRERQEANKFNDELEISLKIGKYPDYETMKKKTCEYLGVQDLKGVLLAVKAATGTGKTHSLMNYLKHGKIPFFLLAPTNNLVASTVGVANRLGLDALSFKENSSLVGDINYSFITCPEQSFRLESHASGRTVILDEAATQLATLASGGTVNGAELPQHRERISRILSDAETVILLDANLSDDCVEFYRQASGKKVVKVQIVRENPKFRNAYIVQVRTEKDERGEEVLVNGDYSGVIKKALEFKTPLFACDSRRSSETFHRLLQAEEKKGIVINKNTSHLQPQKDFIQDPQKAIADNQYDYVIYSPTMAQGVSIDFKYFDAVFAVFIGTLTTDNQIQMLTRCRDTEIPYFIYCPERSTIPVKDRINLNTPEARIKAKRNRIQDQAELRGDGWAELTEAALNKVSEFWEGVTDYYQEKEHKEKQFLLANLIEALKEHNFNVNFETVETDELSKSEQKEIKKAIVKDEYEMVFKAAVMTLAEALQQNRNPTPESESTVKKASIMTDFPGIENQDFWEVDFLLKAGEDREFYKQIKSAHFLAHPDQHSQWDSLAKKKHFTSEDRELVASLKSLNSYTDIDKIYHLKKLGIQDLIDTEIYCDHPLVRKILDEIRKSEKLCVLLLNRKFLGKGLSSKDKTEAIKKLLGIVGYELKYTCRKDVKLGERYKHYQPTLVTLEGFESASEFLVKAFGEKVEADLKRGSLIETDEEFQDRVNAEPSPNLEPSVVRVSTEVFDIEKVKPEVKDLLANNKQESLSDYLTCLEIGEYKQLLSQGNFTESEKLTIEDCYKSIDTLSGF